METYKFKTKISRTGEIQIPIDAALFDKEVEIIIVPKQSNKSAQSDVSNFLKKWSGFLSEQNTDDTKYKYLTSKYQ